MRMHSTILGVLLTIICLMVGSKTFGQERNIAEEDYVEEDADTYEPLADSLRYMLNHRGFTFRAGYDMRVASGHQSYGALFESSWHMPSNRLSLGVGAIVGVDAQIADTVSYSIGGSSGEAYPTYHRIEDNSLSIPIYATISWAILPKSVSPEITVRIGGNVSEADAKPYLATVVGCHVALERVAVIPYIGCVWNEWPWAPESDAKGRFNFGLLVVF